jgi:hypothetical protein
LEKLLKGVNGRAADLTVQRVRVVELAPVVQRGVRLIGDTNGDLHRPDKQHLYKQRNGEETELVQN